ncbi:hypothetical protein PZH43_11110, partial [Streptococcus gordonii]|nr:hypothetical protein [Streptococcus gordonii]
MLKPLGDRVVLKIEEKEEKVGGFVIAGNSHAATKTAAVVAVGQGVRSRLAPLPINQSKSLW